MKRIALNRGIQSLAVMGNDQLAEFFADGRYTTVHTTPDLDYFSPRAIMRLIQFFPSRLTLDLFWSSGESADQTHA